MRLEYLDSGSRDCPLLRLYGSDSAPARAFSETAAMLSASDGETAELHRLPGVVAVDDCQVMLRSSTRSPLGISRLSKQLEFVMHLKPDYWTTVSEILAHFVDSPNWRSGAHVWLIGGEARGLLGDSPIGFVVSSRQSGQW